MSDPQTPVEDIDILDKTARIAIECYGSNGGFPPFLTIESAGALKIVPSQGFSSDDQKRQFMNLARFLSIEHAGRRSAMAMESWMLLDTTPESLALLDRIYARGGSMSEHPDASEAIVVIGESDVGSTMRQHGIVRDSDTISLKDAEMHFTPAIVPWMPRESGGIFSDFHVPTFLQASEDAQAFADTMRGMYRTNSQKVEPTGTERTMN